MRGYLLAQSVTFIPATTIRTYGIVDVCLLTDRLDERYRPGDSSTTRQA